MKLLLMGLRGAGKSTAGMLLARRVDCGLVDLDEQVRERLGVGTVTEAWERFGEEAFRAAETLTLADVLRINGDAVIALGGGTPTAPGAEKLMRDAQEQGAAVIVYLRAIASELRDRLECAGGAGEDRPSLTGADALEEMESVLAARDGLYSELADAVVDASRGAAEVVEELVVVWTRTRKS